MEIKDILSRKDIKPSAKTLLLGEAITMEEITINQVLLYVQTAKEPAQATCMEALEIGSKHKPALVTPACMKWVKTSLSAKASRLQWESAKVVANCIHLYPAETEAVIHLLCINAEQGGTVVRWSAAAALKQIALLNTSHRNSLLILLEQLQAAEEKNSIRKIYAEAIKKATSKKGN